MYHIKLNVHLLYDPAIPLLGIYPREKKEWFSPKKLQNVYSGFIYNH